MSIASQIIEGEICAYCTMPFTQTHGYPAVCLGCWDDEDDTYQKAIHPVDVPF
jgi:hypothetical protein